MARESLAADNSTLDSAIGQIFEEIDFDPEALSDKRLRAEATAQYFEVKEQFSRYVDVVTDFTRDPPNVARGAVARLSQLLLHRQNANGLDHKRNACVE